MSSMGQRQSQRPRANCARHTRSAGWRALGWALLWASALTLACSGEDAADTSDLAGGQTGSLLPGPSPQLPGYQLLGIEPCSLPRTSEIEVVEGDAALVIYPAAGETASVQLTDGDGQLIETELEDIEGTNAKLARTSQALTEGEYTVEYQCSTEAGLRVLQATLEVTPASALPTTSGTLEPVFDAQRLRSCDEGGWYTMRWVADADLVAFGSLLALSVQVNQGEAFPVLLHGQVQLQQGALELSLPRCPPTESERCLPAGPVRVDLLVDIAGEEEELAPASLSFDTSCVEPTPEPEEGCTARIAGAHTRGSAWTSLAALLTALLLRRRRSTRSAPVRR